MICDKCKYSMRNNGTGDMCDLEGCFTGELFDPVEKTYNLLELESGFLYGCDEARDRKSVV